MATPSSAISAKFGRTAAPALSWKGSRISGQNLISMGTRTTSRRSLRLRVLCAAKPEMVTKVMDIVKQQLALKDDANLTADSKFTDLGADSLDTVEIVMALEEEFKITVEEDNAQSITTIQEAADLIDKLVGDEGKAA
ncbi:acyl carrier protein 4, chloroplastic-like [Lolium rigidum]|uniref:acyl carrier protein 4, chloroplastic-like n=1 Tax=Lolium rigidum TaxID=89674 RepID=UPI001F5E19BA|nr:acyl carrier protein 4, chloroplastic-like [Lolium rigidum]